MNTTQNAEPENQKAEQPEENTAPAQEEESPKRKEKKEKGKDQEAVRLQEQLDAMQKELDAQKDQYLRLAAEYDNFRKRSQREREAAFNDSKAAVLTEILPVIDNFERAAQNKEASYEDFQKGIDMTFQQLMEIFTKLGAEPFGEAGEPFDPNIHNAVMHVEDEAFDENVVTDVFSKGYKLGDRVLRHAMVKVAN
uniref:nucleotide exchange factor GrpE n=1 Tax=Candidatus Fimivicinus sp. TaxID=3056640 RepID=UPI003FF0C54F